MNCPCCIPHQTKTTSFSLPLRHLLRGLLTLLAIAVILFGPVSTVVTFAAPLPDSEIKALSHYPNWVAAKCDTAPSGDGGSVNVGSEVPDDQIPGSSPKEKEWNYLIGLGFTPVQAAGILGNIGREGVYDPQSIEDGDEKVDPQTHQLVGRTKNYEVFKQLTTPGQDGYGLIGFTPGLSLMKAGVGGGADWSGTAKVNVTKDNFYFISTQLDVVYGYMKNSTAPDGKNMLQDYTDKATSPSKGAEAFQDLVENAGVVADGVRDHYANAAMNKFGHGGGGNAGGLTVPNADDDTPDGGGGSQCCNAVPANPDGSVTPVTGDIQSLAKQVMANKNITFDNGLDGPAATQFERLAKGEEAQTDTGRHVNVQPILMVVLLHLAENHKVQVSSLTDGPSHTAKDNPHGMGDAVDIDFLDGAGTNGSDAVADKIIKLAEEVLPNGSRFGIGNGTAGTKTVDGKTFTFFNDNPNHVHVDVVGVDQNIIDKAVEVAGTGAGGPSVDGGDATPQACCPSGDAAGSVDGDVALSGSTNAEKAFNYFISQGAPPQVAAGIVGNMMTESAGNTEDLDTHAHNDISGTHDGIVQWSTSRWGALKSHEHGKDPYDLATQLDYAWYELTKGDYRSVLAEMKSAGSAAEAATIFNEKDEVSGDTSGNRETNAKKIFSKYGSSVAGGAGGGSVSGNCAGDGVGGGNGTAFILDGYAWPVDMKKSEVDSGYPWPCPGNCHHDNTPAFDLSTTKTVNGNGGTDDADVVGRSEFAITDGTIDNLHVYDGISGCYSFHIKSSTDGYDYYYTHTRNPAVHDGQKVNVGGKVSEVGERKCTGNGSYPHLHIDRGSPKGAGGGNECCRDPGLVPIINKLYANLP